MLHHDDLKPLLETKTDVFGSDGEKIGTLGQVYLDDGTDLPHFATVNSGFFGSKVIFVPLTEAEISHGRLYVKFPKHFVKDAPNIEAIGRLSPEDEDRLYAYYSQAGLGQGRDRSPGTATPPPDRHGEGTHHRRPPDGASPEADPTDGGIDAKRPAAGVAQGETTAPNREPGHREKLHEGREPAEDRRRATPDGPETLTPGRVDRMDP